MPDYWALAYGRFLRVEDGTFPQSRIMAGTYEWQSPPHLQPAFTIRFISPDGEPAPRDYHVQPLLEHWFDDAPTAFLEDACARGYQLLSAMEKHTKEKQDLYRAHLALFRNRHAGHVGMGRRFRHPTDFVDLSNPQDPGLLLLGLEPSEPPAPGPRGSAHKTARELLRAALPRPSADSRGERGRLSSAPIRFAEDLVKASFARGPQTTGLHSALMLPLTEAGEVARALRFGTLRRSRSWDAAKAEAKVRGALIYGLTSEEEYAVAIKDDCYVEAEARIVDAASARSPEEFDHWLKNVREHKYLQLLGCAHRKGKAKEDAACRARAIYCALLWKSYQLMSQCYGMLMYFVAQAMCSPGVAPEDLEVWLFSQRHFPYVHFAGLPFDFLEKPQFRWISRALHELWRDLVVDPQAYDTITNLLGIYGDLARDRRTADKGVKERSRQGRRSSPEAAEECIDPATEGPHDHRED